MPGVAGVWTAADLNLPPMPASGAPDAMARPVLATGTVRFLGEAVAVVVADTRAQAIDAAEAVDVDYEPLEVVTDPRAALADGAPGCSPRAPTWPGAPLAGAVAGPRGAEVVVSGRFVNQRVAAAPIEPNAAVAVPEPERDGLTLYAPAQAPFWTRDTVAEALGLAPDRVRVVVPAVGGVRGRIHLSRAGGGGHAGLAAGPPGPLRREPL